MTAGPKAATQLIAALRDNPEALGELRRALDELPPPEPRVVKAPMYDGLGNLYDPERAEQARQREQAAVRWLNEQPAARGVERAFDAIEARNDRYHDEVRAEREAIIEHRREQQAARRRGRLA